MQYIFLFILCVKGVYHHRIQNSVGMRLFIPAKFHLEVLKPVCS